ncbi:hypothetical protein TNCV_2360471 [Trichonephila clavipes]|nr:hypothetical protein TNCV_2360471 [Trichonephila clavipes]
MICIVALEPKQLVTPGLHYYSHCTITLAYPKHYGTISNFQYILLIPLIQVESDSTRALPSALTKWNHKPSVQATFFPLPRVQPIGSRD